MGIHNTKSLIDGTDWENCIYICISERKRLTFLNILVFALFLEDIYSDSLLEGRELNTVYALDKLKFQYVQAKPGSVQDIFTYI